MGVASVLELVRIVTFMEWEACNNCNSCYLMNKKQFYMAKQPLEDQMRKSLLFVAVIFFPATSLATTSNYIYKQLLSYGDTICAAPIKKTVSFLDSNFNIDNDYINIIYPKTEKSVRPVEIDLFGYGTKSRYSSPMRIVGVPNPNKDTCSVSYSYSQVETPTACLDVVSDLEKGNSLKLVKIGKNGDGGDFYLFHGGSGSIFVNQMGKGCYILKSETDTYHSNGSLVIW